MTPDDLRRRLEAEVLEAIDLGRLAQVRGRPVEADRFASYAAALLTMLGSRALLTGLARELPDDFGLPKTERG